MRDLEQMSDEALARQAARGADEADARRAAAVLLGRYSGRIYQWARRYVREHEAALDLAQDVMLSAWRHLPSYQSRSRFFAWLFVITRNRCLNELRRPPLLLDEGMDVDRLAARGRGPDRELEERLDEREVLRIIAEELDAQEQDAIYLRCFERMPVDEISATLGIGGSAGARSVLQRARRKLREALERRGRREDRSLGSDALPRER